MRKEQILEEIERITALLEKASDVERVMLEKKVSELKEQLQQANSKQLLNG